MAHISLCYMDRGDPSSHDFTKEDFIADEQWHELDLSNIVSKGAKLIHLKAVILTAYVDSTIGFCKKGSINYQNGQIIRIHGSNREYFEDIFVACDDRKVEYWMSAVRWDTFNILIRGWFT